MAKVKLSKELITAEVELSDREVAWRYGSGPFVTLFQAHARLLAMDPTLTCADLRLLLYITSIIGKDNSFFLDRKLTSAELQMNESTISRSINKLIKRRIILKDERRSTYYLSSNSLILNNRVACKCGAGDYSNEHTPLLLSDDCSHSQLPLLIHSSKYIVRKLTVDGKEFDALGPNEEFEG